jgi:hypothetical protein
MIAHVRWGAGAAAIAFRRPIDAEIRLSMGTDPPECCTRIEEACKTARLPGADTEARDRQLTPACWRLMVEAPSERFTITLRSAAISACRSGPWTR